MPITPTQKIASSCVPTKILIYSARKRRTNPVAPNSVLNPDTNSLSASVKSNGARLNSKIINEKQPTKHTQANIMGGIPEAANVLSIFQSQDSLRTQKDKKNTTNGISYLTANEIPRMAPQTLY